MNPAAPVTRYRISPSCRAPRRPGAAAPPANGTSSPFPSSTRQRSEKNRVITTPSRNSPRRGSGRSPRASASASSGYLLPAASGSGERAAEARVDVGHGQADRPARGSTARSPARRSRSSPRPARRARSARRPAASEPLIDSPPFDWIIERGIALRQRPSRSQKTSIENSSPRQRSCTIDSTGVEPQVERELLGVVGPVDVARAEPLAHLDEERIPRRRRELGREPRARARDAVPRRTVREVLVPHRAAHLGARCEHERRRERRRAAGDDLLVEIGERDDEAARRARPPARRARPT